MESGERQDFEKSLRDELDAHRRRSTDETVAEVLEEKTWDAESALLFYTKPDELHDRLSLLLARLDSQFTDADPRQRGNILQFLCDLSIDLKSALVNWHLVGELSRSELAGESARVTSALSALEERDGSAASGVHRSLLSLEHERLKCEAAHDPRAEAEALLGDSLAEYARNMAETIEASNFYRLCCEADRERTELGNDSASYLRHAMRVGCSFATTDPASILGTWRQSEGEWNDRADGFVRASVSPLEASRLAAAGGALDEIPFLDRLAAELAAEMAFESCRLLRALFLISGGRQGHVSVHVSPLHHDDSQRMAGEAEAVYAYLERRLGGRPNVLFKLPATPAGLNAAERLTSAGIGVTITLTFGLFQALEFAKVLGRGSAPLSCIAFMNGRLAGAVREELEELSVPARPESMQKSAVTVVRRICRELYRGGGSAATVDRGRVRIMVASLRVYGDDIPDISELWGVPLITLVPSVRYAFDRRRREVVRDGVARRSDEKVLEVLRQSETFRQAWWLPSDPVGKPIRPLGLGFQDAQAVSDWKPVAATLAQFLQSHRELLRRIAGRVALLNPEPSPPR